jgi:nucleoside-diphosphate-sugar epimerase
MLDALIVGGDSQIGKALWARLRQDARWVVATTRKRPPADGMLPFDLRFQSWLPVTRLAFFCTGINGFKPCEDDPEEARRINVTLLTRTARRLHDRLAPPRLVFLSSSAAETHPDTVYGKCKLDAERVFLELGGACYRFGPVALAGGMALSRPGQKVYPNEVYSPINLSTLTDLLAGCFERWEPGLHCIYNRDWVPDPSTSAQGAA